MHSDLDPGTKKDGYHLYTMPESDFEMNVAVIKQNDSTYDKFRFIATGDWKESPYYEYTDVIGLGWTDNFTLYDDYSYILRPDGADYNATSRNDIDGEAGVAHDVNLQVGKTDSEVVLVADVRKHNSSGTMNVKAEYGHVIYTFSDVSVSFGAPPSIGMSVGWGSDIEKAVPDYEYVSY